jgi:hypothetical protein
MRKFVLLICTMFFLSCLVACNDNREGMKLSKQPYDASKCAAYRKLSMEALKKNERDIVASLTPYNDLCFSNMDSTRGAASKKAMEVPR